MRKFLAALLLVLMAVPPAVAQTCPPVPALPDTERATVYTLSAQTGPFSVGFQLYGDSTDYQFWFDVYVDGVLQNPASYTVTSPSGPLATICRPISDAQITFVNATTGTVRIIGDRRPRRAVQFTENRGVSARDHNRALTDIVATQREQWDRLARSLQVRPGETIAVLPDATTRGGSGVGTVLGFNAAGALALYSAGTGGGTILGPGIDISVGSILGDGSQHLTVSPTANPTGGGVPPTLASISIQGVATSSVDREFLANFGLTNAATSNTPAADKVALYAGVISVPNTLVRQDQWSFNTVNTLSAGTGTGYAAQGYELDFNNMQGHRGDIDGGAGLAAPVAYGLSISGASAYRSSGAMLIAGSSSTPQADGVTNGTTTFTSAIANFQPGDVGKSLIVIGSGVAGANLITTIAGRTDTHTITLANAASDSGTAKVYYVGSANWNRGIIIALNSVQQASFQDLSSAQVSLDIRGFHVYGIDMGVGAFTAGAIRIPNNMPIVARTTGGTNVNVAFLDASNVFQIGGNQPVNSGGPLSVRAAIDKDLRIGGTVNLATGVSLFSGNDANNALRGMELGASLFYFSGGNVGIANSAAVYPLDITGDMNITGAYRRGGVAGVTCSGTPTGLFASVGGIVTHC